MTFRAMFADAARFWETGRVGLNGGFAVGFLTIVTVGHAWTALSKNMPNVILLIVATNVVYSLVYAVDLGAQTLGAGRTWRNIRWAPWACLFVAATFFGALAPLLALTMGEGETP